MRYEGSVYRPPSEASSLIVQATIGCSHNQCKFCTMYKDKKFRIRPVADILEDLTWASQQYGSMIERVFLADGDALIMKTKDLLEILNAIKAQFENVRRVGIYGSPQSILLKSEDDLRKLKDAGLGILYLGIESGSAQVLDWMDKGVSPGEMVEAGQKVRRAGIVLSAMVILGLGGAQLSLVHARESAVVCSAIKPEYLSLLTLMTEPGSLLLDMIRTGEFSEPTPEQALRELRELVCGLELENTVLRSNHASNYVSINGRLPKDKDKILGEIDRCLQGKDTHYSTWRRL